LVHIQPKDYFWTVKIILFVCFKFGRYARIHVIEMFFKIIFDRRMVKDEYPFPSDWNIRPTLKQDLINFRFWRRLQRHNGWLSIPENPMQACSCPPVM